MVTLVLLAVAPNVSWAQSEGTQQWPWPFFVDGYIRFSSPAFSNDGETVYIGVETRTGGRVLAISTRDGASRWGVQGRGRVLTEAVEGSPAVGPNGTIYIGGVDGRLYALNPADGSSVWERFIGGFVSSSPAIGDDGTIYVGASGGDLHAFAANGTPRWTFPTGGVIDSSPAIGADGTIYFGSYDRMLYAVNRDGTEKWRFATGGVIFSSPAIGADGTIYFGSGDQRLYALAPNGTKKWEFFANGLIDASPSLGADGTVYFAADRSFYALRPDDSGERLRWRVDIGADSISSAAIRSDGTIIFGASDGILRALNPDGTERWRYDTKTGPGNAIESSPMIAPDGSIFVGSFDGNLYKITGNGSPLSRVSSWPAFRRNLQRGGRILPANTGGQLINISSRARAGGNNNLVAGFVVQGGSHRLFFARAVGPGLTASNVHDAMPDPWLELYSGRVSLRTNDNWLERDPVFGTPTSEIAEAAGAFRLQDGSKDAVIAPLLPAGAFTAQVRSTDGQSGVALVEIYQTPAGDTSTRLVNLSTRGQVGTGEDILIAGFVVAHGPARLLLRGIGPGLEQFGVPGVLARPRLAVFREKTATPFATNAGWTADGHQGDLAGAAAAVGAFPLNPQHADCALLLDVAAGAYTMQISGMNGAMGEAMVEIYLLR